MTATLPSRFFARPLLRRIAAWARSNSAILDEPVALMLATSASINLLISRCPTTGTAKTAEIARSAKDRSAAGVEADGGHCDDNARRLVGMA